MLLLQATFLTSIAQTTTSLWQEISDLKSVHMGERSSLPTVYRAYHLDLQAMIATLNTAKDENLPGALMNGPVISLPMPDGTFSRFHVAYTEVMPRELADQFPTIRTFIAKGIDDPYAVARLDYTQWGFHSMIMSPKGWTLIDPASLNNTGDYICYNRSASVPTQGFVCEVQGKTGIKNNDTKNNIAFRSNGATLKTYRLALACTGEYAAFFGGTVSGALAGMITSVNRVNGVYELELAVRMVLIPNNNLLVYTNSSTDPYTNNSGGTMLGENQTNITTVIGSANYDFGHVFSTGGGGVANLGCICSSGNKARGVTGSGSPTGDSFDLDYVAHEMGHQFGGNHTFNSVTGSCSGNNEPSAAYEPGSGTTIMAYAGICGADDIEQHSDAIFHTKSFDEIVDYITTGNGNSCPVTTATLNTPPVVASSPNYTIPFSTPFILTGSATDADNDPLTYLWEEFDLGPAGAPNSPSGNAPIFRDFVPVPENYRIFPKMQDIVRNTQTLGEILPTYARSLTFRLTARDNKPGGAGVSYNDTLVNLTVINTTTPFQVTSPNTAVNWYSNTSYTVTWDVSSTNLAPINCANVNIYLSLDSGYTYPYTLLTNTPNDGSETVTLPNVTGTKARIKVAGAGNIFFDISNVNFTISSSSPVLTVLTTSSLSSNSVCAGSTFNVDYLTDGPANAGNIFTAQLSNASGSFASPVTIGTLSATTAGTISVTIPGGTVTGTGYLIRIISSNPAITGASNGTNLILSQNVGAAGSISGSTTVCQGQTGVVYSVPSVSNATSYVWTLPAGATITAGANSNSITVTYSNSALTGAVTVRGTNAGCGNGAISPLLSVTVNNLPNTAGTITGATSICPGQTGIVFSVPAITGATGYSWTLPSGVTIASGANSNSVTLDFSPSATSGIISAAGTNACGNGSSSSLSVTTLSTPQTPSIVANGPTNFCPGDSVLLSFSQNANTAYQWRKNGTSINGATGYNYNATDSGLHDVVAGAQQIISNTENYAIPDGSCTGASSIIAVSGYTGTVPSSGISVKINITHGYVGDLVIRLVAPNGAILGLSNRTGNNNNSGNNFTNTIFSDAGAAVLPTTGAPYTGTYKPVAATFTSCSVTSTVTTFGAIGGGTINPNGNWTLSVYDRSSNDAGTIVNWAITIPASVNGPCSVISNVIAVTENASLPVSVGITTSPSGPICEYSTVTFTANPVNGGSTPAYQWKIGTTNAGTNSATFMSNSLSDGDVITCELTSNLGCAIGSPAISNSVTMTVSPFPQASFTFSQIGLQVTFVNTSTNANSYYWNFGDGNLDTTMSPVHTYLLDGNYLVLLMATDTCGTVTDTHYVNVTASYTNDDLFSDNHIEVIQLNDMILITYHTNIKSCYYYLTNVSGQIIFSGRKENIIPGENEIISLDGLSAGMYFLNLTDEFKTGIKKLYKLH